MGNGNKILGPTGQPLRPPEPKLVILKTPKGFGVKPQLIAMLGKATGCNVINLPMDSEIMMGGLALQELQSVHIGIHAILDLPNIILTRDECSHIRYLLKISHEPVLGAGETESQLLRKLDEVLA